MSSKTLVIYASAVIILIILGMIFLFGKQQGSTTSISTMPNNYMLQITYKDKTINSSVLIDGKLTQLNSLADLANYGIVTLNNTHDIMWILCKEGYNTKSATSPSGNEVFVDQGVGANTTINDTKENSVIVECVKK